VPDGPGRTGRLIRPLFYNIRAPDASDPPIPGSPRPKGAAGARLAGSSGDWPRRGRATATAARVTETVEKTLQECEAASWIVPRIEDEKEATFRQAPRGRRIQALLCVHFLAQLVQGQDGFVDLTLLLHNPVTFRLFLRGRPGSGAVGFGFGESH